MSRTILTKKDRRDKKEIFVCVCQRVRTDRDKERGNKERKKGDKGGGGGGGVNIHHQQLGYLVEMFQD